MQRLLFGVTLGVVVIAVTLVSPSLFRGDATLAVGPTPTKIANDGNLAGVSDILVGDLNIKSSAFYCIVKTDHELSTNAITTYLQCNIDIPAAALRRRPTRRQAGTIRVTCWPSGLRRSA